MAVHALTIVTEIEKLRRFNSKLKTTSINDDEENIKTPLMFNRKAYSDTMFINNTSLVCMRACMCVLYSFS